MGSAAICAREAPEKLTEPCVTPMRFMRPFGPDAITVKSDAASLPNIDTLAACVKSEFGTLDALLICASQTRFAPFESVTEAMYDELLAVNTKGAYFTVQKLAPLMIEGSAVVMITSVAMCLAFP